MLKALIHFTVVNKITILKEFWSCLLQFPCFRLFPEGEPPGGTFRVYNRSTVSVFEPEDIFDKIKNELAPYFKNFLN